MEGVWYWDAILPNKVNTKSVFTMPGSKATIVIPFGISLATDLLKPSIAHFELQYADAYITKI